MTLAQTLTATVSADVVPTWTATKDGAQGVAYGHIVVNIYVLDDGFTATATWGYGGSNSGAKPTPAEAAQTALVMWASVRAPEQVPAAQIVHAGGGE